MTLSRLLTVLLLGAFGGLLAVGAAWRPTAEPTRTVTAALPAPDRAGPLAVLSAWDRSRAAAWRRGDVAALRRLYAAGSEAGRADRELLAAYAGRGLRVSGVLMQRAAVEVVALGDGRMVLDVTERVVRATAIGPEGWLALPRDGWSRHRVVLRDAAGGWRVVEARAVSGARPPSPT